MESFEQITERAKRNGFHLAEYYDINNGVYGGVVYNKSGRRGDYTNAIMIEYKWLHEAGTKYVAGKVLIVERTDEDGNIIFQQDRESYEHAFSIE